MKRSQAKGPTINKPACAASYERDTRRFPLSKATVFVVVALLAVALSGCIAPQPAPVMEPVVDRPSTGPVDAAQQSPLIAEGTLPPSAVTSPTPEAAAFPFSTTPHPTCTPEPMIPITQPQVLTFLRRTLHKSSRTGFTKTELGMITYAELSGPALSELPDLALLPNLETLVLKKTSVADFSPLADSARLFSLTLEQQPPMDAAVLLPLQSLTRLTLSDCPLYNAGALADLPHLEQLILLDSGLDVDTAQLKTLLPKLKITIDSAAD